MLNPTVHNKRHGTPLGAVYVGRGTKWGNPFVIGRDGDRATVIAKYRKYILPVFETFHELWGKDLVCYCAPLACHADLLLQAAEHEMEQERLECEHERITGC